MCKEQPGTWSFVYQFPRAQAGGALDSRARLYDANSLRDSLSDHIFYKFQPSVVAAACVGASRICLQLSPYWTRDLQRISNYSLEQLSTCIEILLV